MDFVHYNCLVCDRTYKVLGSPSELQQLLTILPQLVRKCVADGCGGRMSLIEAPMRVQGTLRVQEFIAALAGLGLPEETDASPGVVAGLLATFPIVDYVVTESAHPRRSILKELTFSNRMTLHLAGGAEGPIVYKVTRRTDGLPHLEFQTNTKDDSLRLSSGDVPRAGNPSGDVSCAPGGGAGESASAVAGAPSVPGGVQETKG